ncbi:MAG: Cys-Gln thioester bond-forming surface protein, partial [Christensenellaceae bacterium]|nr:Cys-Gln thioester bond-forming surface protein [Christensenellaceae bacterium]
MVKKIRKAMVICLAIVLCMSLIPATVFADGTTVEINEEGLTVTTTTKTTEETDENGNVTLTITIDKKTEGTTADGTVVDRSEYREDTTVTDANGNEIGTSFKENGSETITESKAPQATVTIPGEVGASDSAKGDEVGTERPVEGGSSVVVEQGDVTVTTDKITVTEKVDGSLSDLEYVYGDAQPTEDSDTFKPTYGANLPVDHEELEVKDGYQHVYVGEGNNSQFYAGIIFTTPGSPDEQPSYIAPDGTKYYSRGGWHKMNGFYHNGVMVEDTSFTGKGIWTNIANFILIDAETGKPVTTYCADITTYTQEGFSYNIENVEDADYYSDEQAAMIRTVAKNGYWSVVDDPATPKPEFGSLEAMREMMRDAKDADGNNIFTDEEIELLNEGIAMTATQYSVWNFSNKMDGFAFFNCRWMNNKYEDLTGICRDYKDLKQIPADKLDSVALIFKLYHHLVNLAPSPLEEQTTSNTIINEDNFLGGMSLTVLNKADDHENNKDDDKTNDAYNTKITFALVVAPSGKESEDLVVSIVTPDGTVLAKGRLTGELRDGEMLLTADENGNYSFDNVVLTEDQNTFRLNLSGVQNLEQGVYLYTSEVKEDGLSSQTMVGVAEGMRGVDVTMELEISLDVNDEVVVTERIWEDEGDPIIIPPTIPGEEDPNPPLDEDPNPPTKVRKRVTVKKTNTETILDEEVPLAAAPKTGDYTFVLIIVLVVVALGIVATIIVDKKRKN